MTIVLNKEAAAHRLIVAAVEMCERADEPLAIHVVAASALNILRELIRKRGTTYGSEAFKAMLIHAAQQKQQGINVFSFDHDELNELVDYVSQLLIDDKIDTLDDLGYSMSWNVEKELLKSITEPFKFLKHADRDSNSLLPEGEVEPVLATMSAISAFAILFPNQLLSDSVRSFLKKYSTSY